MYYYNNFGFPGGSDSKASACSAGDPGSIAGSGRFPWRRKWQPTPVLLPEKSHRQKSLVDYRPWGRKESDTTEWLQFTSLCLFISVFLSECKFFAWRKTRWLIYLLLYLQSLEHDWHLVGVQILIDWMSLCLSYLSPCFFHNWRGIVKEIWSLKMHIQQSFRLKHFVQILVILLVTVTYWSPLDFVFIPFCGSETTWE